MPLRLSLIACLCGLTVLAQNPPNPAPVSKPRPALASNEIEAIEFSGTRRMPQDTLRALILTKTGDVYNEQALNLDLKILWNTSRFSDIQMKKEAGARGGVIVRFIVTERQ